MGSPVVWFEIGGQNAASLRSFYGDLLGWKLNVGAMDYAEVDTQAGGAGIPGGIWAAENKLGVELGDYVTVFAAVTDLDDATARAEQLGAKAVARFQVPEGPTVQYLRDPEGHLFGMLQPPS